MAPPTPDLFLMGDFDDNTSLGDEAAVFLHRDGLIESFPLLGVGLERARRLRRWVVKVEAYQKHLEPHVELRNVVHERLGHDLRNVAHAMQSRFGVQHYLARRFVKGRIALAGDAAHVVSPIGGQGNEPRLQRCRAARAVTGRGRRTRRSDAAFRLLSQEPRGGQASHAALGPLHGPRSSS
jgi:2-polyprenyl-6-methoxyphenol hydroxylase-like FAD-dependent oxidoreductase